MGESGGSAGVPVTAQQTRCVAGVVAAIVLGVVGATFGSWFGSTHTPVVSSEEAMAVSRAALGDVSPPVSVERVNTARPFAYHGDVVVAGYVLFEYDADFGDQWHVAVNRVATRLRSAGWEVRVHHAFFLDDPACDTVAATNRTTAVQIEICEVPGLGVTVTNTVSSWLVPSTLLGGLVGLALGGLLGAGPIARRFGRAAPPYRWYGLASGALTLAGLAPGAIIGLLSTVPLTGDLRFATPFWFGPAEVLSNGDPATFALVIGLTGFVVTWWRANPRARIRNPALSTSD